MTLGPQQKSWKKFRMREIWEFFVCSMLMIQSPQKTYLMLTYLLKMTTTVDSGHGFLLHRIFLLMDLNHKIKIPLKTGDEARPNFLQTC